MPLRTRAGLKAKKKAEKEALLAEAARLKEIERLKEEERLAVIAAEKARIDAEIKAQLETPEGQRRDLLKFLYSCNLSRKCFNRLERELSDGVLVAEIVAFYCPDLCDPRHYFTWYSSSNKKSNWDQLNRKVFPELGFELKPEVIRNLIRPYGGCGKFETSCFQEPLIYQVLRQVREGIAKINPDVYEYRKSPDFKTKEIPCKEPKPKFERKPRVDLNIKPPYSKIEIQIANGMFDEEDAKKKQNVEREYNLYATTSEGNPIDWVEFDGPGGGILFEEGTAGNYKAQPMCPTQRCWTCL